MIVTVVSDVLGVENNGVTIAAMNLIRSLKEKGHTVRVLCPDVDRMGQEGYYIVPTLNAGPPERLCGACRCCDRACGSAHCPPGD